MAKSFVHLHVHSEYSLLDGLLKIDDLIKKAAGSGMPAVALTDHGNMYGVIDFYKRAKAAGIKPIIGCEVYQAPKSRFIKKIDKESNEELYNHLTLIVKNNRGYKNLMKLVSLGFLEGFYYKPRIDAELLGKYSEGLIALSGCLSGKIPRFIESGKLDQAEKAIQDYIDIFGKDNFYLELTDFGLKKQKEINRIMYELSKKHSIPVVATNDIHYLNREDFKYHFILLCIQAGATIGDFNNIYPEQDSGFDLGEKIKRIITSLAEREEQNRLDDEKSGFFPRTMEYYFKEAQEMERIFSDFPGALETTSEIASRCDVNIEFDLGLIPPFKVPEPYVPDSYLEFLCLEGAKQKYGDLNAEVEERLKKELQVIKKMGFAEYFLIVWDFVRYAKSNDIRVGPGRGSAAGSIVSYLLDITDIEPLQYDLLFERFLNEERKKMPDIDIDFCDEKRDKVLDYVSDKYGENRVAQLITFGTMAARQAIRDSGRVLEVPYSEVDKIAKLVPAELNMTIDNAIDRVPELQEGYNTDKKIRDIIDTARSLEGKARQHSIHAAGVVISAEELFNYTPIQQDDRSGEIKTQYKMEDVQDIGLLKMDFLGLKTLSLIDKTLFLISKTRGEDIDINDISLEDRKTYRMLGSGDCLGVFQLESSGMRELIISLRPERFEDIIATLALFRPGPLQSGMVKDFVEAKNKKRQIKYLHSSLEPILKETYGIIVYQEQIMMIASKLAGFSMSEADILRDAISKKKSGLMAKQKTKFLNSAGNIGIIDKKTAEELFKLITHFAEYGFNKSHSTAYAMISYQTAYLKANYPVEFLAAILSIRMGSQEKVAQYINEARRIGIRVLPPDINESFADFTVVGKSIRFGLSAIKNVGSNVIELIVKERKEKGRFADFHDFCRRASSTVLNKKTVESLIKAGVFDSLRCSRKFLLENCENIVDEAAKMKKRAESGQFSLFDETENEAGYSFDHKYPEREEFLKEAIQEEYSSRMLLNFEKEILGLYISGHPLADYEDLVSGFTTVDNLDREKDKSTQVIAGVVVSIKQIMTRSNQPMYFLTLEDLTDSIEVIIFPAVLEKFRAIIEEDKVLWIKGKLDKKEDQTKFIAIEIEDLKKMRGRKKTVSSADDMEEKIIVENPAGNVEDNSTGFYNNRSTGTDTGHVSEDTGELARNRLILKINKDVLDRDVINKLYEIIGKNPGSITVELKITNGNNNEIEKSYSFPQSYGIDLNNSLFEQLRSQFGEFISWEMPPDIK